MEKNCQIVMCELQQSAVLIKFVSDPPKIYFFY